MPPRLGSAYARAVLGCMPVHASLDHLVRSGSLKSDFFFFLFLLKLLLGSLLGWFWLGLSLDSRLFTGLNQGAIPNNFKSRKEEISFFFFFVKLSIKKRKIKSILFYFFLFFPYLSFFLFFFSKLPTRS